MKKMVKSCTIKLYIQKSSVVTENSFYRELDKDFHGDKNDVMSYLRKYLISHLNFTGKLLTSTMNELGKTSNAYKGCGEGTYETIVHAFNPATETLYTFKVKYNVEKLSNLPGRYRTNHRGENLYEKRLIQLYGGGRLGRYRLAIENVNTDRLLELLAPMIKEEFRRGTSIEFSSNNHVEISYPRKFEFKPNDDLSITIRLNEYRGYTASVDIVYKGSTVWLLSKYPSETITEEKINGALSIADKFDEICEIVKKAYNL